MAEYTATPPLVRISYNEDEDTLMFAFRPHPRAAVAEEVGDEVWLRYDPVTHEVVTMEILHFSCRIEDVFGPSLLYTERTDTQRISALYGLQEAVNNDEEK